MKADREEERIVRAAAGAVRHALAEVAEALGLSVERPSPAVPASADRGLESWAICQRICEETIRVTPKDAARAVELAQLAVRVASRVSEGEDGWRSYVEGWAWAHLANARRVADDHDGAEKAFAISRRLRAAGTPVAGRLDEGRPLDLEASLRRCQRRFPEALALHDRALRLSRPEGLVYVLLDKAVTFEQAGSYEKAVETLTEAARHVGMNSERRLLFGLRFNLAVNRCHLGHWEEAGALLPELRELAASLGNDLDLVRVRWLEGKVAAGMGARGEAIAALDGVRGAFTERRLPYDMALASLELATLYLEEGRTAEVRGLAEEMLAIFQAQGVLSTARPWRRSSSSTAPPRADTVTADLARRLAAFLDRARHDLRLRFEG